MICLSEHLSTGKLSEGLVNGLLIISLWHAVEIAFSYVRSGSIFVLERVLHISLLLEF